MNDTGTQWFLSSSFSPLRTGKDLNQDRWRDTLQAHLVCKFLHKPHCSCDTLCTGASASCSWVPRSWVLTYRLGHTPVTSQSLPGGSPHSSAPESVFSWYRQQLPGYYGQGLFQLNPGAKTETHGGCDTSCVTSLNTPTSNISELMLRYWVPCHWRYTSRNQSTIYQGCRQPSTKALDLSTTESFQLQVCLILWISHLTSTTGIKNVHILPTQLSDTQTGFAQSGKIRV